MAVMTVTIETKTDAGTSTQRIRARVPNDQIEETQFAVFAQLDDFNHISSYDGDRSRRRASVKKRSVRRRRSSAKPRRKSR